jgi:uncharacterized RDD family membrane protein YckC
MLDTAQHVETPEGISLELPVAGPVARFYAFWIDLLLRGAVYFALGQSLPQLGEFGVGLLLVSMFFIEWLYAVPFEVLWNGQTPGKRVVGLRVLMENGVPVGWGASVLRNLLRAVDFLPGLYGFGLISMLADRRFRRLGDMAAGTVVAYVPAAPDDAQVPLPETLWLPPRTLRVDEQRAVMGFAQRHASLTPARAIELAETLSGLLGGARGPEAVERLRQLAAALSRSAVPVRAINGDIDAIRAE